MKKLILLLLIFANLFANEKIILKYQIPKNDFDKQIKQNIIDSKVNEDFVDFVNETFKIEKNMSIIYGYEDGPLYLSENNTIYIPYSFVDEVMFRFEKIKAKDIKQKTFDALLHTLFHELGHLLVFNYEIPVLGKEEDAVDSLANIILLEYYENGAQIAQNAAELFLLESKDIKKFDKIDFWGEHSLDIQRYYSIMCYIYGSNYKINKYISERLGYDKNREEFCIEEYDILYNNWFYLLEPLMKK